MDWYEAWAEIDGEEQKVYLFWMRSMASGGAFHRGRIHATTNIPSLFVRAGCNSREAPRTQYVPESCITSGPSAARAY